MGVTITTPRPNPYEDAVVEVAVTVEAPRSASVRCIIVVPIIAHRWPINYHFRTRLISKFNTNTDLCGCGHNLSE
jgi:hypothetical protein